MESFTNYSLILHLSLVFEARQYNGRLSGQKLTNRTAGRKDSQILTIHLMWTTKKHWSHKSNDATVSSLSLLSYISWTIWQWRVEGQVKFKRVRLKDLLRGIISDPDPHSSISGTHNISPFIPPSLSTSHLPVRPTYPLRHLRPNHKWHLWLTNFTVQRLNCSFTITIHLREVSDLQDKHKLILR